MSQNVLVTGATGFVGGNLVRALVHRGCSVTCLVRNPSKAGPLQKLPVRLVIGSLKDPGAIREVSGSLHTVYHVAAVLKAARRDQYFQVNQLGTRKILEMMAESNPCLNRFVHISSLAAAGPSAGDRGLTEDEKPHPISWYGESKLESEKEVLHYAKTFPVTILRPSAVYGPGDRETLLVFRMIRRGCLFTPGRIIRRFSLIHVEDLTAAIIGAGERDTPSGEVYFVSRPETYLWEDIGRAIAQVLGKRYRQVALPHRMALAAGLAGDLWARLTGCPATINGQKVKELLAPSWICDSSRARTDLGFRPAIDLETGIRQTVCWYRNHGWL